MGNVNITSLISALRGEIEKGSISPENIGYLLQLIYDYSTSNSETLSKKINDLTTDVKTNTNSLTSFKQTLYSLLEGGGDVVEFLGIDDFVDSVQDKTDKSATDEGCTVVYNPTHSAFFLRVQAGFTALYYKAWNGSAQWNRWLESAGGYRPRANKLYVSSDGALYWWNSVELLNISGELGVGNEEITEALSQINNDIQNLYKANEECGERNEELSKEIEEVSKELEGEKQTRAENIETIHDTFRNLATINGHSLLDGGDIVIVGDGVIEEIPDEFIEQLGSEE